MRVKSKPPPPASTASAIGPCPTVIKIVGRPGTGSLPSTIAPPDHPQFSWKILISNNADPDRTPHHMASDLDRTVCLLPFLRVSRQECDKSSKQRNKNLPLAKKARKAWRCIRTPLNSNVCTERREKAFPLGVHSSNTCMLKGTFLSLKC